MLKKIANFLFSTRLTAFLFLAFAIAMAIGTFLDVGQKLHRLLILEILFTMLFGLS